MLSKLLVGDSVRVVGRPNHPRTPYAGFTGTVVEASFNSYKVQLGTQGRVWFHREELERIRDNA